MKEKLKYAVVRDAQLKYSDGDYLELLLTCEDSKTAMICKEALEKKESRSEIGYYVCRTKDFLKGRLCYMPVPSSDGLLFELVASDDGRTWRKAAR